MAISPQIGSWYFIIPRLPHSSRTNFVKKGESISLPLLHSRQGLLEDRLDGVGVVGFVRFAEVALTAELSRRGRVRVGDVVDVRVVRTVHEEERGIVLAAAVTRDRAGCRRRVHGHYVLVVAGGGGDGGGSGGGGAGA